MQTESENISHPGASVEVLVIGGGVLGSSIAYHVARQGRTVLVVERSEGALVDHRPRAIRAAQDAAAR